MSYKRVSFEEMALNIAIEASKRSEDPYSKVGCCILNDKNRILSVGYNGLIAKKIIKKNFWGNRNDRRKYIIHAETNALALLAKSDKPHVLASSLLPCSFCATNIIAHGIKKVIYRQEYAYDQRAKDIFKFYDVKLIKI